MTRFEVLVDNTLVGVAWHGKAVFHDEHGKTMRLRFQRIESLPDALRLLQMAVQLELSTLPPYLYALYSIRPGTNAEASSRIRSVVYQEMIHMCLACNIMNSLGKAPSIASATVVPHYPGPLPGDIGSEKGELFVVHLLPFSKESMEQGMKIEEPEEPIDYPDLLRANAALIEPEFMTIGQFYNFLDKYLATLPEDAWKQNNNQITDAQFFAGELFAVNGYDDAHRAIQHIVSQGEGSKTSPLDFQNELAHYYRFEEIFRNQVLTKANNKEGFAWSATPLGVDWAQVYPAISDPGEHDFSADSPEARAAQGACDEAFSQMLDELQHAVEGDPGALGKAVRAMFDLRMATTKAFNTPLADGKSVAGPSFRYRPKTLTNRSAS